jgi:DNA-binding NtrC family response regulator
MTAVQDLRFALIVEHDDLLRAGFRAMLDEVGLAARTVSSLAAALVEVSGGGVNVVVANISVGESTGSQILQAIRSRDADVPVVFITAWPEMGSELAGALRQAVVTAAGHRVHRRVRRQTSSPGSPPEGEP